MATQAGAINYEDPSRLWLSIKFNIFQGDSIGVFTISNSSFLRNFASSSGGVIAISYKLPKFDTNNIFINNSAIYGPNFASYPVFFSLLAYKIPNITETLDLDASTPMFLQKNLTIDVLYNSSAENRSLFSLHNVDSGSQMGVNFYIQVLDHFNQSMSLLNGRYVLLRKI